MRGRSGPVVLLAVVITTFVVSVVGLIGSILLNAFAFDEFDAYGEVRVPGSAVLHLPAGEVNVTFHTRTSGSSGTGPPIPPLELTFDPPDWVDAPELTESFGGTTIINGTDVRQRVWKARVPSEGEYRVTADGEVDGYIAPRLAFGHGSPFGWVPWIFGALLALSLLGVPVLIVWAWRRRDTAPPFGGEFGPQFDPEFDSEFGADEDWPQPEFPVPELPDPGFGSQSGHSYIPTDRGIRIEQLKDLAALRASGALTEDEYEKEKRRVLDGG